MEAEELLQHEGVLVGRALHVGGDSPVVDQAGVGRPTTLVGIGRLQVVEADRRLGVADVEGEEHGARRYGAGHEGSNQ